MCHKQKKKSNRNCQIESKTSNAVIRVSDKNQILIPQSIRIIRTTWRSTGISSLENVFIYSVFEWHRLHKVMSKRLFFFHTNIIDFFLFNKLLFDIKRVNIQMTFSFICLYNILWNGSQPAFVVHDLVLPVIETRFTVFGKTFLDSIYLRPNLTPS